MIMNKTRRAEVYDLHFWIFNITDENIFGFEITMNQMERMDIVQTFQNLCGQLENFTNVWKILLFEDDQLWNILVF